MRADAVLAQEQIVVVRISANGDIVAGLTGSVQDVHAPGCGLVVAEDDGRVYTLTDGFQDTGLHLSHDVNLGIIQYSFGNGDNDRQLFGGEIDIIPCLSGRLLHAGVTVDPVGHRQHIQHLHTSLTARHVGQLTGKLHKDGRLGSVLQDGSNYLLLDQSFGIAAGNDVVGHC